MTPLFFLEYIRYGEREERLSRQRADLLYCYRLWSPEPGVEPERSGVMPPEKSVRRMTLRQLISAVEKGSRDLVALYRTTLFGRLYEVRDVSRPIRQRSRFPTMQTVQNALTKLQDVSNEAKRLEDILFEQLQEIRDRAQREQK